MTNSAREIQGCLTWLCHDPSSKARERQGFDAVFPGWRMEKQWKPSRCIRMTSGRMLRVNLIVLRIMFSSTRQTQMLCQQTIA